jgi:hypothetical protein
MLRISAATLFVAVTLLATIANAQKPVDDFFAEMFSIKSVKIGSTLEDLKKNKDSTEKLSFRYQMDNRNIYDLTNLPINLPGLKPLDRLMFDTLELTFEDNKLHDLELYVPGSFRDEIFDKTCKKFDTKYGEPTVVTEKGNSYKRFIWNLGTNELFLKPYADKSFLLYYGSKIAKKKTGWVYTTRRGKGDGTLQLNLGYFEKLLQSNLSVESFEKRLPQWKTSGDLNHVRYELNFKTMADNCPNFDITYTTHDYDLEVKTFDTVSKIISEVTLKKIKQANTWELFERDLKNLNYTIRPRRYKIEDPSYVNDKKDIMVILNKANSMISITNVHIILP